MIFCLLNNKLVLFRSLIVYFGGIFGSLRTLNCPARTSQFHHEYLMILSILSIFATNNNTNNMNSWTQYNRKEKYNSIQYNSRQLSLTLCVVFYRPFAVNAISNRRKDHNQIIYRYIYMQKIQIVKSLLEPQVPNMQLVILLKYVYNLKKA